MGPSELNSHSKGAAPHFAQAPPVSLYVHLPWCIRKCPYCDFNSHAVRESFPEQAYLEALIADLRFESERCEQREIATIFIGGGTPSLFSPSAIGYLLEAVASSLNLRSNAEITLEANPGASDQARFSGYRAAGVNRLSIGIQTFDDRLLKAIGRVHDSDAARAAAEIAHPSGFDNFNLDLMYGLPGQSPDQAEQDLRAAISLEPSHISWYQLTLEPNTEFHHHPPVLPDEDRIEAIETAGRSILRESGYTQYEVSAYARSDRRCRHNMNYWTFGDYLGIGAGAHGKLTDISTGAILRYSKERHPQRYMEKAPAQNAQQDARILNTRELSFEFMLNALRLTQGFESPLFKQRTGLSWSSVAPALAQAEKDGLIASTGNRIETTELGKRYLNDLISRFLPNHDGSG